MTDSHIYSVRRERLTAAQLYAATSNRRNTPRTRKHRRGRVEQRDDDERRRQRGQADGPKSSLQRRLWIQQATPSKHDAPFITGDGFNAKENRRRRYLLAPAFHFPAPIKGLHMEFRLAFLFSLHRETTVDDAGHSMAPPPQRPSRW